VAAPVVLVMGVSSAGKSTVGAALAAELGWAFLDGDDLHPAANIAKMSAGIPLTDADRAPWFAAIGDRIDSWAAGGTAGVVAASALKRAYREGLRAARPQIELVYLGGDRDLLAARLERREGHFMPPGLLDSQLATLEPPGPEERAILVDISLPVEGKVAAVVAALRARAVLS
jgi:carbohydrate kinase (thermoresistant glucokinase family)